MDYYNTNGDPYRLMEELSGDSWNEFKFGCGMFSMIYHTLQNRSTIQPEQTRKRYRKYGVTVKCIMRYTRRPLVVKHLVLKNYHARGGSNDSVLRSDLDSLVNAIVHQRRHKIMSLLARALCITNALEPRVPREIAMEIASY